MQVDNSPTEWELDVFAKSITFVRSLGSRSGLITVNQNHLGQLEALHNVLTTIAHDGKGGPVAYGRYADGMAELIEAFVDFVTFYGWIIGWCVGGEVRRSELNALKGLRDKLYT